MDEAFLQMREAALASRQDELKRVERLRSTSRARLLKIISTKLRTSFVGALAVFEQEIGKELWGHGKPASECTSEQLLWRAVWENRVRAAVLSGGNNQIRATESELQLYEMMWTGYRNRLTVVAEVETAVECDVKPGTEEGN